MGDSVAEVNNYLRQRIDFFLDSLRISTGPSNQHQPLREFTWTIISYQHHNRIRFTESQEFIPELRVGPLALAWAGYG